jgi:hypothetical protein
MMPIYLLGPRTPRVQIPNQALSISITGSVEGAALYVHAGDAEHNTISVNPHVVIVPAIADSGLMVGVEPVGTATFGHHTIVHLSIAPDSPDEVDPEQVAFDTVDVSGAQAMELAVLTPRGNRIEVAARAVGENPLSPLASIARTAARRSAGKRQYSSAGPLWIAVDTSASMKKSFDDGSVGAAIDMIVGVADVVGIRDVGATLVGTRCTPVDAPVAELAQAVSKVPIRWSAGVRWSQLPDSQRTIVVTDWVNSSLNSRFRVMCISDDARLRAAGPLLPPPPSGIRAEQHLDANLALVDEVAAALLQALA